MLYSADYQITKSQSSSVKHKGISLSIFKHMNKAESNITIAKVLELRER